MADEDKNPVKAEKQGLSLGEKFAQATGGHISAMIHRVREAMTPTYGYGGEFRMIRTVDFIATDYLSRGRPMDAEREAQSAFMSPRAGFLHHLESALSTPRLFAEDSEAKTERMRQTIVSRAASELTVGEESIKGEKTGRMTPLLPYAERMEHLKWLITDQGHDANENMLFAINNDRELADWMLEKGGAEINHVDPPNPRVSGSGSRNLFIHQMSKLMWHKEQKDDVTNSGRSGINGPSDQPRDRVLSEKSFKGVADGRTAAIYADPGMSYIMQRGATLTPEVKDGAVAIILADRKSIKEQIVKSDFEHRKPYYDVMQREGLKNGVNVMASPKLLAQAIEDYKQSAPGTPERADAKAHYRYVMDNGYKDVTPKALDELITHWKQNSKYVGGGNYQYSDMLSAVIQEGRLSKDQVAYVSQKIADVESEMSPTMNVVRQALEGKGRDMMVQGVPDIIADERQPVGPGQQNDARI